MLISTGDFVQVKVRNRWLNGQVMQSMGNRWLVKVPVLSGHQTVSYDRIRLMKNS